MNFSKATDFQYVYGDLSSIIIDNDIMPVRPEATKKHLRGMDIAFVTTAKTDEEAKELLTLLGMPFRV